ncbi:hypothetical protein EBZ38_16720 [bacterium]|nr:hypothetical protein [bacterium]NDC96312.1 hypothetical protein [bacterium]NDD85905.1 hypothetical protein [bacterium]
MPTPCQITSGYTLGCRDNIGSIKNLFILSGSVTAITNASEGLIQTLTGSGSFFKFELFRETSDFAENLTVTPENGTIMYETTTNAVFFKMQVSTRNQIRLLSGNQNIKMIVETNNGDALSKFVYVGRDNGVTLTTSAGGTGTAMSDRNGYALTFVGREPEPSSFISASTYAELAARLNGLTIQTGSIFGPA